MAPTVHVIVGEASPRFVCVVSTLIVTSSMRDVVVVTVLPSVQANAQVYVPSAVTPETVTLAVDCELL